MINKDMTDPEPDLSSQQIDVISAEKSMLPSLIVVSGFSSQLHGNEAGTKRVATIANAAGRKVP